MGSTQCPQVEALWRLHPNEVAAFDGLDDAISLNPFDGVAHRDRRDNSRHVTDQQPCDYPLHQIRSYERSRSVMDEHESIPIGYLSEARGDRILPPITTWDGASEIPHDDQLLDASADKGSLGPLPQRQAVEFDIVFPPSKACAEPGRQQNPQDRGTIVHGPHGI
jgi:hypothetical protein